MKNSSNYDANIMIDYPSKQLNLWIDELRFVKTELKFLSHFIKSYPFESKTPNLFERIQEFIKQFDIMEKSRLTVLQNVSNTLVLIGDTIELEDTHRKKHLDVLLKEINEFREYYRALKANLYEYAVGIMK